MQPSPDLRAKVLAAAAASPARTRASARRSSAVLLVLSFGVALGIFESMGGLEHSSGRPFAITMSLAIGWALASAALTYLALTRAGSTLARPPLLLGAAAFAAPVVMFLWLTSFEGSYVEPYERVGYRCLGMSLAMAALPLATVLVLRRGTEPRRPAAFGAIVGAMCGAWSGVLVDLWCPLTNRAHVLVGHVLPLAVLIGAGALVGARIAGARRAR